MRWTTRKSLGLLLYNIFINDINDVSVNISTLRQYANDKTQYGSDESRVVHEFLLNKDVHFLQVNASNGVS